ncbi:DUF4127 family protein [Georgenia subflava]|uniref:DUF4127 family protein n=1 Tax=Georgenia subflava TaxID=1622177 RepID=A0A6N7EJI4_9MICO|nr:DUF4127 family protein [Georgenia subflava]MPV35454.1 DUF4127 family protein [Georgenia subflava]
MRVRSTNHRRLLACAVLPATAALIAAATAPATAATGTSTTTATATVADDSRSVWRGDGLPPGQSDLGEVALVPLDDRPYTWYAPLKLGAGAGYEVTTPEHEVLGRHFTPGDGAAAAEWLVQAARQADDAVVALPMLAYGGLLNSRNSSVPQEQALANLEAVRTVKKQNPGERLYAFDTIMRLTPEGPWRTDLRIWATLVDEVENLGQEDKRAELEAMEAKIPQEVRDDYLATRQRNHELNLEMIEWAAEGIFDYLIIGQDDASGTGLHRPEAAALAERIRELGVEDRVVLYPGADTVSSLLLAKLAVEDAGTEPAVYVEYSRVHGSEWTAPYQNIPYEDLIEGYVNTIGGRMTTDIDDADVVLMANTGGSSASVQPFADRVIEYVEDGRTVALGDDAIAGRTDMRLMDLLDPEIDRGELVAYSGWNIGIPISQSLSRDALLHRAERGDLPPGSANGRGGPIDEGRTSLLSEAAEHTLELTLSEWVQTNSYRTYVRNDTTAYASSLGEPNPQDLQTYYDEVDAYAREHTLPYAQDLFDEHFDGVARPVGTVAGEALELVATDVEEWNIYLPWLRTGEIAAEPEIAASVG